MDTRHSKLSPPARFSALAALIFVLNMFTGFNSHADGAVVLVQSNDIAPGGDGRFLIFSSPRISNFNQVIFSARLSDTSSGEENDSAIYQTVLPTGPFPAVIPFNEVVREDDMFSASEKTFHIDDLYAINSASLMSNGPVADLVIGDFVNTALMLPLVPNSGEFGDSIIVLESNGSYMLVAEAGTDVASNNGQYREFNVFTMTALSTSNELTFFAALDNTELGSADNTVYFRRTLDSSINEIVRKGDAANAGSLTLVSAMYVNDFGASVFVGSNDSDDSNNNSGLYRANGTSYSVVVHEGDLAPQVANLVDTRFLTLAEPRINNQQDIGFTGRVINAEGFVVPDGTGLFIADSLSTKAVLIEGQATPDGTATFFPFISSFTTNVKPVFNDMSQFAFKTQIQTTGGQADGVFIASENELIEIARTNDSYEDGALVNFSDPLLNNEGLVVIHADLVTSEVMGDEGIEQITDDILIISDGSSYQTVERAGNEYNGKIVREISVRNSFDGQATGFNDLGAIVYAVLYEDGSQGIHAWQAPIGWQQVGSEGEWDEIENWGFGGLPDDLSDVSFDFEADTTIFGPTQDTSVNSLSIGGSTGLIQMALQTGTLTIEQGLSIEANGVLSGSGSLNSEVENNGQITVPDNASMVIMGALTNNGEIVVGEASQLTFSSLFTGPVVGNQVISGSGTIVFAEELNLADTPSLLSVQGDLAFTEQSQVNIKVEGLQRGESYDAIDVGASINLAGTLNISLSADVSLQEGEVFTLMSANLINGNFNTINLPEIPSSDLELSLNNTGTSLELVVSQSSPADEPTAPDPDSGNQGSGGSMSIVCLMFFAAVFTRVRLIKRR